MFSERLGKRKEYIMEMINNVFGGTLIILMYILLASKLFVFP